MGPIQPINISEVDGLESSLSAKALNRSAVAALMRANSELASRAECGLGTVVGADNERLCELLAQTPDSSAYELRFGEPVSMFSTFIDPTEQVKFDLWWNHASQS